MSSSTIIVAKTIWSNYVIELWESRSFVATITKHAFGYADILIANSDFVPMSNIQLRIPYKTVITRQGRLFAWALWPVWAILAPLCILLTLGAVAAYPAIFAPGITALLIGLSAFAMIGGGLFTAVAQDDQIYVSNEGLYFPKILMPQLGFHKYLPWDRLTAADVITSQQGKKLRIVLRGHGAVNIDLNDVPETDIDQLLLAIELWGDRCDRAPQLVAYQHEVQNAAKGLERVSYTQMWESELSRRFSTTAFIPLEPGSQLQNGRLKVVRQLSFGGFSAIYLVQDNAGQFMVAKEAVIPPAADAQHKLKAEEHFAREASHLSRLQHDAIAKVIDHFSERERNYILLEYIEGQNLRQLINEKGAVDEQTCTRWALQLAAVIDYLHSQQPPVIHRDISPDNVMQRGDGSLVLIDFGAANAFVTEATGTLVGKQAYMPPEQLRGKAVAESDYYAFGATLHFLLTGQEPIPLAVSQPARVNPGVGKNLDRLVAQLTAFESKDRKGANNSLTEIVKEHVSTAGART